MFQPLCIIIAVLLFACAPAIQIPVKEPVQTGNSDTFRSICIARDSWESSFNPYELFDAWEKLRVDYHNDGSIEIVVGNPKIDWRCIETLDREVLLNTPVPEGEIAATMSFRMAIMGTKAILMGYIYLDKYGIIYLYFWDEDVKSFVRSAQQELQDSI